MIPDPIKLAIITMLRTTPSVTDAEMERVKAALAGKREYTLFTAKEYREAAMAELRMKRQTR